MEGQYIKANDDLIELYCDYHRTCHIVTEAEKDEKKKNISDLSFSLIKEVEGKKIIISKPIYVFYHCFLTGRWIEIFERQLDKIYRSGLYDKCSKIFISVVGNKEDIETLKDMASTREKIEIVSETFQNSHEFICLQKMKDFCEKNDCFVLYLHLKGVARDNIYTWSWAEYMEHFCIEKWELCVKVLELGYDCSGVDWISNDKYFKGKENRFYYSGNFFFANSRYIKKLPSFRNPSARQGVFSRSRYECERWIELGKPNAFCFRYSLTDLYSTQYGKEKYITTGG